MSERKVSVDKIIVLECELFRYDDCGKNYKVSKVLSCIFLPIEKGRICEVCGEKFKKKERAVMNIMPEDEEDTVFVCHKDCHLLMTVKYNKEKYTES